MLDLDHLDPEVTLPNYTLKAQGQEHEYDMLAVGFKLRVLEGIEDPEKIREVVVKIFELGEPLITTFEACLILEDFRTFTQKFDGPLKKVFGRSLFSDTTTDSAPEKLES